MAGPSWLVDGNRFASKIRSASATCELGHVKWQSNPTRSCPSCHYTIDNSDVAHEWPGLPRGVKFDPTDQEIIQHLLAKVGIGDEKPHPFINEFIPSVDEEGGICYTHPQNLPGVKQDGSASHFFHRAIKAYNTGTRKRRKIRGDDLGDVRWHKTGRTKPVVLNGVQRGCKKIMVLYVGPAKGGKAEKTNWVMHQYHLGTEEDEKDGDYVISKVFYQQQQQGKSTDKNVGDISEVSDDVVFKVDPVTPKSVTPEPPRNERRLDSSAETPSSSVNPVGQDVSDDVVFKVDPFTPKSVIPEHSRRERRLDSSAEIASFSVHSVVEDHDMRSADEVRLSEASKSSDEDNPVSENHVDEVVDNEENQDGGEEGLSQYLLNSQQLVEGLFLCDEILQESQSPNRDGNVDDSEKNRCVLSEYARLGADDLKKDLEECQNLDLDPANIELDTPPEFRLSQLEFGSQDSFLAWGGSKFID